MQPTGEVNLQSTRAGVAARSEGDDVPFRQYQAPRRHGHSYIDPDRSEVGLVLRENAATLAAHGVEFDSLRRRARRQLVDDAIRYTDAYRDVAWVDSSETTPIIMAGHQPALFHAGVWFKNFALSQIAAERGATAINLIVDNDVASGSSIRVPTIDAFTGNARYEVVPYDLSGGGVPYEQTTVGDRQLFDHFDRAVAKAVRPLVDDPCITQLWPHARAAIDRCGVAGCALAQARHGLEGEIGLKTLELPMGVVCRGTAFSEFALSILTELPRFHRCYNDSADVYRQVHGIRSSAHPVPNLAQDDEWFEAPLWVYSNDSPARKGVWVRWSDEQLVISDRAGRELRIDVRDPNRAAQQLSESITPDFKLRPRALLTTMYARLVLSDLFLHGIGGAKYDQLGDMITRSFFSIATPQFMVVSATVQLPNVDRHDCAADVRRLRRQIRDTHYQPERFSGQVNFDAELLERKQSMLADIPPRETKHPWHAELSELNATLSRSLSDVRASLQHQLAEQQKRMTSQAVLTSREHPFCIFPLAYLTETFESLLSQ